MPGRIQTKNLSKRNVAQSRHKGIQLEAASREHILEYFLYYQFVFHIIPKCFRFFKLYFFSYIVFVTSYVYNFLFMKNIHWKKRIFIKSIILHFLSFQYFKKQSYSFISMFLFFSKSRAHLKLWHRKWPTSVSWPHSSFTLSRSVRDECPLENISRERSESYVSRGGSLSSLPIILELGGLDTYD